MKTINGKILLCVLFLLISCVFCGCNETKPVFQDLTATDGGVGRETLDPLEGGTDPVTDVTPPESTAPVTGNSEDTVPPDDDPRITICLDAGDGFGDGGTGSGYLGDVKEKDITLAVVKLLEKKLDEMGFRLFLTHDGVTFPETILDDGNNLYKPQERVSYAKRLDIDFFLSIHCDSYPSDPSVRGTRLYYSNGTSFASKTASAAECMKNGINAALPNEKKAVLRPMDHESSYYVVRENRVPSVLIEIGFVSNAADAANMLNPDWLNKLAEGIAAGLLAYFNK